MNNIKFIYFDIGGVVVKDFSGTNKGAVVLNKKILIILAILLVGIGVFVVINSKKSEESQEILVGGDRDEHGCIGSAGYTWCEAKQKCLRNWEEACEENDGK